MSWAFPFPAAIMPRYSKTIGMFVNTLPIRCRIDDGQSVGAFIQYLRAVVLEAFNNQDYPFEELVNALKLPRSTNQNPLLPCALLCRICIIPIWS